MLGQLRRTQLALARQHRDQPPFAPRDAKAPLAQPDHHAPRHGEQPREPVQQQVVQRAAGRGGGNSG
jgi:hypothetical protein